MDHVLENSYWRTGEHIIKLIDGEICCFKRSFKEHFFAEFKIVREILEKEYSDKWEKVRLRLAAFFTILFKRNKEIWLLIDRNYHATDSASAMFRYISRQNNPGVRCYFALSKNSKDYSSLKKCGRIVDPFSFKFKRLFLSATCLLSAHADWAVVQPFTNQVHCLKGLFNYEFIYLQHGVLHGNLDSWLNVLTKNIKLLTVSTKMEMKSILDGAYGYTEEEVKLLGLARLDLYYNYQTSKKIAFLPTWRQNLAGSIVEDGRTHAYVENFRETDYCRFYNALINDERLLKAMKDFGYTGEFYLHPCFEKQVDDFDGNSTITFCSETADYPRVLGEAAMLVTDYSGVQYDFAYLKKPLVYTHFDSISNGEHSYVEKYLNYETDGFGPITKTLDDAVEAIIKTMKSGCLMEEKYKERVDRFFYYHDNQNCKRIYDELMKRGR